VEVRTGTAKSGDIEIYYEDIGNPDDPAVLLIMGLGAQLTVWRKRFCEKIVNLGMRVIRFDNRDVGLSTKFDGRRVRTPLPLRLMRMYLGLPSPGVYTLEDMADDAVTVLDHLGIDRAHVVGGSMGGMIAQIVAGRYADRTRSLSVMFSSNNQAFLPPPGVRQLWSIISGPPDNASREAIIENAVRLYRINGSPAYPTPEEIIRADAAESYDRCYYPVGIARQFDAILASGSLKRYNRMTTAPTLVIHGTADKLMRPTGGKAVAKAIPHARLVLIEGMGHELPEQIWEEVLAELKNNFSAAT